MKSLCRAARNLLVVAASLSSLFAAGQTSGAAFDRAALPALTPEQPYDFRDVLVKDFNRSLRDPGAKADSNEMEIPAQGWSLVYSAQSGPVLKQAVTEFQTHLLTAMQVRMEPAEKASLQGWRQEQHAIIVGVKDQMPGCGGALTGKKDYEVTASDDRIAVCGYDERGAMLAYTTSNPESSCAAVPLFRAI